VSTNDATRRRVVLHVGLYKTGTTYLQSLMRQNRRRLAQRRGVYVPANRRKVMFASFDLIPRHHGRAGDARVAGAWSRLVEDVEGCGLPCAVISEERLSGASARQARRAVQSFGDAEVHVVVTVRDLARVVVSHWQERVKNGATWPLEEYVGFLRDPEAAVVPPAVSFWLTEASPTVLRTWASAVPAERLHVVTVPPSGAPPHLLAERFGSVAGFTPADVPRPPEKNNENIGVVGAEMLRRLNERLEQPIDTIAYEHAVKRRVLGTLTSRTDRRAPRLTAADRDWADALSAEYAGEIARAGYHVVGDLDDLRPDRSSASGAAAQPPVDGGADGHDDQHSDRAILDAALDSLANVVDAYGAVQARSDRERAARRPETAGSLMQQRARLRTAGFAAQTWAAHVAGRTRLGRRVGAAYLRRRAGR